MFEVFILNQEITWIAHNKVEKKREKKRKRWVIMHVKRLYLNQTMEVEI